MHGTVEDICTWLMETFDSRSQIAVLVWNENDVQDFTGSMDITREEACTLLASTGDHGDHRHYGIGRDDLRDMLTSLRRDREDEG